MEKTLREIAALVDGNILGESEIKFTGATSIEQANLTDITFAVEPHLQEAEGCNAGAVIIPKHVTVFAKPAIQVENPRVAFTKLLELFTPPLKIKREVHSTVIVRDNVKIGKNVAIMPYVVIDDDAVIEDNAVLYPYVYVGQGARVGESSTIYPNVTIREFCEVGKRDIIHSGAVIGSDGFGFVTQNGTHNKVPQVGNVVLEDDVEIGANVGIDRATTGSTRVKRGTKVDNLVHLGHNVQIGEGGLIVAQTGIAGSTKVGHHVTFAGQCGCVGHIEIGDNCTFAARTAPINNVPSGSFYAGFPARPHKEWLRVQASLHKAPNMMKKMRELEKRLAELEKNK
ncbi:UDP-3-O-(3-hydroxymyristoyl)glucosamine N-acyltransferase [Anaerosinus gibii]|uniref:UDP-3-O-acylglucosamine N-acyltransferase n=1 Tax=Selenobaculum gibii TaxID=3054208 RepID=A0A9Y2AJ87_9FIRM|nr:UDP-3-O-(3-hydroxymyristoyl)glucosamine N-acyltransferase [Selenobaculum gbiensis]WIW71033.1 UDP-3-O-(3-hydroxymyristoyl)glucosamine N-acyltransferase [Selenobaculum gbiensis]